MLIALLSRLVITPHLEIKMLAREIGISAMSITAAIGDRHR
jgi:hypothetical protein